MDEKTKILNSIEYLFEVAEREGLWFYSGYQGIWFSPKELREEHANGKFIWGESNWTLRDPFDRLKELENEKVLIDRNIQGLKKRISGN